ncbi:hypothetical protein V6N13_009448 [Hibiscus sabdariffa]
MTDLVFFTKLRAFFWIQATKFVGSFDEKRRWENPSTSLETFPLGSSWSPPLEGIMSLTVDGAATVAKAGWGGVLRDSSGNIRFLFSCPISALGSDYSELMAVHIGLDFFWEANWIDKTHLFVESDSELVVEWIKEKLQRPWRWWKILYDIDCLAAQIKHIKFQHIPREHNYLSDFLAKSGMYSSSSFKEWW